MLAANMRQKILLLFLFLLTVTACRQKPETLYKVVGVKDGDTMVLLSPDNQTVTVRLAQIDCPEKSQAFGQAAKQFTSDLCFGKSVQLVGTQKDRYGRTVGQVVLDDGTNVNQFIVKNGFAWQYRAYSKDMELAALEQYARENQLGLWRDPYPTPPWDFRKNQKTQRSEKKVQQPKKPKRKYKKRKPKYRDTVVV